MKQFVAFVKKHQPKLLKSYAFKCLKSRNLDSTNRKPNNQKDYYDGEIHGMRDLHQQVENEIIRRIREEDPSPSEAEAVIDTYQSECRDLCTLLKEFIYEYKDEYVVVASPTGVIQELKFISRAFLKKIAKGYEDQHTINKSEYIVSTYDTHIFEHNGITFIIENDGTTTFMMGNINLLKP